MKHRLFTGASLLAAIFTLGLMFSNSAFAQATPVAAASGATIEVTGNGIVTMSPDSAIIDLGVDVSGDSLVDTQKTASENMNSVLKVLKDADIPSDQIQTTNYSINVVNEYDDKGNLKGVSGYQVSNEVQVTVTDLDGLGALIDDLVSNGANSINGIQFIASDATKQASQARALAMADAKAKATELAKAAGGTLGGVISITDYSSNATPVSKSDYETAAGAAPSTPIQTGSLQVQVSVDVVYELK